MLSIMLFLQNNQEFKLNVKSRDDKLISDG